MVLVMVKDSHVYVLSGLLAHDDGDWSYRSLAERLHVPHSVVQRALERAKEAELYVGERREVHRPNFEEFAIHALRFIAPSRLGALVSGMPAAWAAEPMAGAIHSSGDEPPPVWPFAQGRIRGQGVEPLHSAAPEAAGEWPELGELLALLDSLRAGDARIRQVAGDLLMEKLRDRSAGAMR
jgi:DNA-binding transcriptional MocR family regulator